MKSSREISDLIQELQEKYFKFRQAMINSGLEFKVTCTFRDQEAQDNLWARGRTEPGNKVTWTRHSKHTERRAFDIVLLKDGRPHWDLKVDVNQDQIPDYEQAAEIGESVGLIAGARFGDYPHFEV